MKKLSLLLLLVSNFIFSQDLKQDLKPFKSISITSAMNVELILADSSRIEVKGKDYDKLSIKDEDNELKLTSSLDKKFSSDLIVKIYYTSGLRYLKFANNVIVKTNLPIKEDFLEIEAINNVKANLSLETKDLVVELSLGSNISLKGSTGSQKIDAGTKSTYNAFNFVSEKTFAEAKAAKVEVNVSKFLDASAKYKGEIIYIGEPNSVNEKTFLGKVTHKKK